MSEPAQRRTSTTAGPPGRGRERLRALSAHRRAAVAAEDAGGAGPPRRAAVPDRPPDVGAVAEARRDRGRRGGRAASSGDEVAPALRLLRRSVLCLQYVTDPARHARPDESVGLPADPRRARSRQRLRLARRSADRPRVTQRLSVAFDRLLERAGLELTERLPARSRVRGPLPAGRAPDRVGRADLGLAVSPLRHRGPGARRGHHRHPGNARPGARQADRPAPAAASCGTRAAGWSSCSTPSGRRQQRPAARAPIATGRPGGARVSGRAADPRPAISRSTSSSVL